MEEWPDLTLSEWEDTRDTLHLWTQIVGKCRLALEPMVNQWWQVTLYVSARGLTTSLMHAPGRDLEMEFDFVDHDLVIRTGDGDRRTIALAPRSVADFYDETMRTLDELDVRPSFLTRPVEVEVSVPFADDTMHHSYDPDAAHRFWVALRHIHRVMEAFRGRFTGKVSPVHYFWGGADLAVTRFSGRPAPKHPGGVPNCADFVQVLAYNQEVSSAGYWPGGGGGGVFYSYAYPAPEGFRDRAVEPAAAYYDEALGEFILPYDVVRAARDPDGALMAFLQSTYEAAADLAKWPRAELEETTAG